jgi:zeta-carotene desaturase
MSGGTRESNYSTPDVLIIGGGLAGLSAAVELTSAGHSVLLVEQKPRLGGRVYSYVHPETGDEVDNGQHLLMGCYTETLAYLKRISALEKITIQKNLSITFRKRSTGTAHLTALPFPAPFNVLFGLLRLNTLSLLDRVLLLRVGLDLLIKDPDANEYLHSVTVEQWLDGLHQSERSKKYLWDIIAIGALNDSTDKISAALFAKVLKSAFFGKRRNSSLAFPRSGLSSTLVDPAGGYVRNNGGTILLSTTVENIVNGHRAIESVRLSSGVTVRPGAVISAVP